MDRQAHLMLDALRELGLLGPNEAATTIPLTGGVSSDVIGVRTASGGAYVVKRSIPRLRVAVEWLAPMERARSEVSWLRFVAGIDPALVPEVLGVLPDRHLFVMRLLDPDTHPVWKAEMAAGSFDPAFAGKVGAALARVHATAAGRPEVAARFQTMSCFMALRIDPFLLFTADRHADVAPRLRALADDLGTRKTTLVQGDISPKNILVGPKGPVFLDAECAVWGDGAFDLAFCLTHLLLKSVWVSARFDLALQSFNALRGAYVAGVDWEDRGALSARAAALVGALLLARVDGKSPTGYLNASEEALVRDRATEIIKCEGLTLDQLAAGWSSP